MGKPDGVLGEGGFEQLSEEEKKALIDNAPALKSELLDPGFPEFAEDEAAKLDIPTLFVYGQQSPKFFHSISDKLAEVLRNTERVFISDASHDTHGDNPVAYNEEVLDFLAKHN